MSQTVGRPDAYRYERLLTELRGKLKLRSDAQVATVLDEIDRLVLLDEKAKTERRVNQSKLGGRTALKLTSEQIAELVRRHTEDEQSPEEIGVSMGISANTVLKHLRERGAYRPPDYKALAARRPQRDIEAEAPPAETMQALLDDQSRTLVEIAEGLGITATRLSEWARHRGVKRVPKTRAGVGPLRKVVRHEQRPCAWTDDGKPRYVRVDVLDCGHSVTPERVLGLRQGDVRKLVDERRCARCQQEGAT